MSTQTRKNISNKNKKDEDSKNTVKKTVMFIILIIIIILSLITSCSCTSGFFGRIGNIFRNDGEVDVDDSNKQRVKVKNQDLKFDKQELEISLTDTHAKLSFSYENINPKEYTCTTSDASIATCYVSDGYVVINPKKPGKVTVTLSTDTNGKTYQATADVTIADGKREIKLSSKYGTINLAYTKTKSISYSLVGLTGDVTVTSSDESVATATAENGVLKITAKKQGKVTITLTLNYDGKEYTVSYNLNVINDKNSNTGKPGTSKPSKPDDNMGEGGDNPENPSEPSNPENPDIPIILDNNTKLKKLDLSWWISLKFNPDQREYGVTAPSWLNTIKLDAVPESDKSKIISYSFNGVPYTGDQLKEKLTLVDGENTLVVTVQAEDGSIGTYKVIIDKDNSFLKELSSDEIDFKFNKNTLYYEFNVENSVKTVNFKAIPKKKDATVEYTFNGNSVTSLNNLYLRTGINVLEIKVTSADKQSVTTYKVVINRAIDEGTVDRRSELSNLVDTLGKLDFNPYETDYNIAVGNEVNEIGFTATPASPNADVVYEFNGTTTNDISKLPLQEGNNTLKIKVTAPDGVTTTTYTVVINKEALDKSNTLTNITILDGKGVLTPTFSENEVNYTVDVDENTSNIGFRVETTNASNITYSYNGHIISANEIGNLPLNYGKNKLQITVGDRTYTITINRKSNKSSDVSLSELTADGKTIINTYETDVDSNKDYININAKPSDSDATVKYYFDGSEVTNNNFGPLKPGVNIVTVEVTAADGITKKSYEVKINKEVEKTPDDKSTDASLKEFLINGESVLGTGKIEIGSNESITSIVATPNDKNATIKYNFNGVDYTADNLDKLKENLNNKLLPGTNADVTVTVTAEDGKTERTYKVNVSKAEKPIIKEDSVLTDLKVKDGIAELTPAFASDKVNYTVNVSDNKNSITLIPTSNGGDISYRIKNSDGILTEFTNINSGAEIPVDLTQGDKYVIIRVTDGQGNSNDYEVKVHKTVRTIKITSNPGTCYIEDGGCILEYTVTEDNISLSNFNTDNLTVNGLPSGVTYEHIEYGKIKLIPDGKYVKDNTEISVQLGIKDYNNNLTAATVKFIAKEHTIESAQGTYDIPYYDEGENSKSIILYTDDEFIVGNVTYKLDDSKKNLTICTEDNRCITVTAEGPITLSDVGPSTVNGSAGIPVKVIANGTGTGSLKVNGSAYGKHIDGPDIQVNVRGNILVTLDPGNGKFDNTPKYEVLLNLNNDTLDLSKYPTPYLVTDDECYYYKFKEYRVQGGSKTYKETDIIKYSDLDNNLVLVAEYDTTQKEVLETIPNIIIVEGNGKENLPLFYNKESAEKYGKEKMIYPGSSGSYTIQVNNKGTKDMIITGMILEEHNICVEDGKCLNMGYIIRDEAGTYYMGDGTTLDGTKTTPTYSVLNKNFTASSASNKRDFYYYANDITLSEDEKLTVPVGETREITIHWKWVELDDALDTKIGNKAAELGENNVDLMYQLTVALKYDTVNDVCETKVETGN